jgi:uncharacterized membrane protein
MKTSSAISTPPSPARFVWLDRPHARALAASLVLAVVGIAVAAYLTVVHYREDLLVCGVTSGCHTVQSSRYAVVAGTPVALLGLGMYLALCGLTAARLARPELHERLTLAAFALALVGVVYAGYLTYVELFVIDALCQWCVVSAIVTLAICVIEGMGVWDSFDAPPEA